MTRILCIISGLTAGGAETFLMKIYRALPNKEYKIDFIVSEKGGCYTEEVMQKGGHIYVIPLRTKRPFVALCKIRNIVKINRYDSVLKLGNTPIAALDLIAAKLGGAKSIGMRSCNALTGQPFMSKCVDALLRPVLNLVANVKIAPSILSAEFTFGKKKANKDVHILHNGVDLKVFHYDEAGRCRIRKEFEIEDKFVVGHVGRLNKQKNHRFLLEVFEKLQSIRQNAVLILIGTGEEIDNINAWIQELELGNKVILAGQRFDIPQILSAMDVMIFPSLHEGMPNTIIEAQAVGLPCLISDTITDEADITGLVKYKSLTDSSSEWAEMALQIAKFPRRDTEEDFRKHGYDIECVSKEFVSLLVRSEK